MATLMDKFTRWLDGPVDTSPRAQWDSLRNSAMTPSHQAEIDAIFARQIDDVSRASRRIA